MNKAQNKSYRKPNRFFVSLGKGISRFLCKFVYNAKIIRNDLEGKTGRCVIIANHESIIDVLPAYAAVPAKTHFVVSKAMMESIPIAPIMEMCGTISKNQFQTSALDMRRMKAVLDHDEPLMFYPAGLMTESGTSTPIPVATAKVLKWFKADIYVARVNGTYLTNPKWAKVKRKGEITIEIYKLASREDYAALSDEEAAELVTEHLTFDAYRHNEEKKVYLNEYIQAAKGKIELLVGTGGIGVQETVELSNYVLKKDVKGALIISEFYFAMSQEEMYRYYAYMAEHIEWELLSPEEKKRHLFLRQKNTLDLFLERNAISKAQYDKSLGDLIEKMGMHKLVTSSGEKGDAHGEIGQ
jgi:hypothetical protein